MKMSRGSAYVVEDTLSNSSERFLSRQHSLAKPLGPLGNASLFLEDEAHLIARQNPRFRVRCVIVGVALEEGVEH